MPFSDVNELRLTIHWLFISENFSTHRQHKVVYRPGIYLYDNVDDRVSFASDLIPSSRTLVGLHLQISHLYFLYFQDIFDEPVMKFVLYLEGTCMLQSSDSSMKYLSFPCLYEKYFVL